MSKIIQGIAAALLVCTVLTFGVALFEHNKRLYAMEAQSALNGAPTMQPSTERVKVRFDDLLPTSETSTVRHTDDGAIVLTVEKLYIWDPVVCDGVIDFQLRKPDADAEPTTPTASLEAPEVLYE